MLRIDADPQVWVIHDETGAEFLIRPMEPRLNQKLLKRSRDKKGDIDFVTHNGLVVEEVVVDWKGVGGAAGGMPASDENKRTMGEKFPVLANWLFTQSTDIGLFCDEVDAAKND